MSTPWPSIAGSISTCSLRARHHAADVGVVDDAARKGDQIAGMFAEVALSRSKTHYVGSSARVTAAINYQRIPGLAKYDLSSEAASADDDVMGDVTLRMRVNEAGQKAVLTDWLQGCFTAASMEDALAAIARTTLDNIECFAATGQPRHPVSVERVV